MLKLKFVRLLEYAGAKKASNGLTSFLDWIMPQRNKQQLDRLVANLNSSRLQAKEKPKPQCCCDLKNAANKWGWHGCRSV